MATQVATLGQKRVNPAEYFSPSAQMISRNPASSSANQAIRIDRWWLCHRGLAWVRVRPVKAGLDFVYQAVRGGTQIVTIRGSRVLAVMAKRTAAVGPVAGRPIVSLQRAP